MSLTSMVVLTVRGTPRGVFSCTLAWYTVSANCGELSLTSCTVMDTLVVALVSPPATSPDLITSDACVSVNTK